MMAAVVAVIVVAAVFATAELKVWPFDGGGPSCASRAAGRCFVQEPVVDIILPVIGSSGNSTNPDRLLNVTVGSSSVFEVDVYPTVPLNVTMSFSTYSLSSGGTSVGGGSPGVPTASFEPQRLSIPANGRGTTEMHLAVPAGIEPGRYAAVISATSGSNSSLSWGLFFVLNLE